ncbi:unnamed protein product, partial [Prorocentrum cordatum]
KLANSYGRWIEAVEEAVLQHSEVPQHQRDGYRGRAQGFGIKWTKSTAAPGRPHLYNAEAEWWAITHTQVIAINGLVKNNKDPQQLQQRGQEFRQRMQQVHVVSKHSDIELLNQWQQSAHDIFSPARQEREDVIEVTERLAGQAARRALADGTKGFIRWAQDMWKKTPGALHRWTKGAQQPRLEEMISGTIVADPILIMNHKSESWAKKWTAAPHRQTALAGALRRCRLSAAQEDLPQLTIQDLNAATHRMGVKKARGIDAIGPLDIERLPDQAKYSFLYIIAQAEEHLMWPPQVLGTIGAIAGKPAGVVESWTQQLEDHWDTALRGSSALRAALLRATLDETGHSMGIAHAELFADMEQFYDSLDLGWLIDTGIELDFSPTIMAMEVEAFLGPRHLKHAEWIGPRIDPSCSIVAGSAQGTRFAKVYLFPLLDAAQKRVQAAGLWTYVDDTVGRVEGTEETVEQQMVELVDEFIIQAEKRSLIISPKTVLVASNPKLRRRIWRRLQRRGLPGKQQSDMVDLGTDVSGMGKRTQKKARARQRKAKQRAGKIFRTQASACDGNLSANGYINGFFTQKFIDEYDKHGDRPTVSDEQWQLPFIDGDGKCDIDAIEYTQLLEDLEHDLEMARRRVGIGVATMKMIDGKWGMSAGTMADLPGRRQTVPRAEITAFAIAIEETRGDIVYVTDHYPLLTAWTKGRAQDPGRGKNADLWARIKRAVMDTSPRHIEVEWTPSHQDEDEVELVNPIFAMGDSFADALATVAAEASWERVSTPIPRTDEWDAICAHVRLRARQALEDTANIDPWCAERPTTAKAKAKRDRVKEVVDKMKQHDMVRLKNKWFCTACRQYIAADALQEFASTACNATYSTANEIVEVKGDRFMGNGKIHGSHVVNEWVRYGLLFCARCAAHGTTIGKRLREQCSETITKYGQDALNKIRDGRYPGY